MQYCGILCVLFYLQLLAIGSYTFDCQFNSNSIIFVVVNSCHLAKNLSENEKCVRLGNNEYIVNDKDKFNWFQADRICRRHGHLVDWKNEEEYDALKQYLQAYEPHRSFWTAYNDLGSEGNFYSIGTGEPMGFAKFLNNQPDNWEGKEDCIEIVRGGLNDLDCNANWPYICRLKTAMPIRA